MFDDEQAVAEVAEAVQGFHEAAVVPRVQADRRLVQDVQHAGERPADLPGQADPLHLPAGERRQSAAEVQVLQPDLHKERQPRGRLLDQFAGHLAAVAVERGVDRLEKRECFVEGEFGELPERLRRG